MNEWMGGWMEKKIGLIPEEIQKFGFSAIDSFDYIVKNENERNLDSCLAVLREEPFEFCV